MRTLLKPPSPPMRERAAEALVVQSGAQGWGGHVVGPKGGGARGRAGCCQPQALGLRSRPCPGTGQVLSGVVYT